MFHVHYFHFLFAVCCVWMLFVQEDQSTITTFRDFVWGDGDNQQEEQPAVHACSCTKLVLICFTLNNGVVCAGLRAYHHHSDSEFLFPFEWWRAVLLQQIGLYYDFFQVWGLMITILTVSFVSLWMTRCSFVAADKTISWLFSSNEGDICLHPEDGWGMSISMRARSRQWAWGTLPEWIGVCDLEV